MPKNPDHHTMTLGKLRVENFSLTFADFIRPFHEKLYSNIEIISTALEEINNLYSSLYDLDIDLDLNFDLDVSILSEMIKAQENQDNEVNRPIGLDNNIEFGKIVFVALSAIEDNVKLLKQYFNKETGLSWDSLVVYSSNLSQVKSILRSSQKLEREIDIVKFDALFQLIFSLEQNKHKISRAYEESRFYHTMLIEIMVEFSPQVLIRELSSSAE